jgi:hypothetical protein
MTILTRQQLLALVADTFSQMGEHESFDPILDQLNLDHDEFHSATANAALQVEDMLTNTVHFWPPENRVQAATGLSFAIALGLCVGLKARED